MSQLIGAFIFTKHGYGNITCIYQNNDGAHEPAPEAAKKKVETGYDPDIFDGNYQTTWLETPGSPFKQVSANLSIISSNGIYTLKWTDLNNGNRIFDGVGWIHEGKLVGSYWQ